jgi:hypothetical protein
MPLLGLLLRLIGSRPDTYPRDAEIVERQEGFIGPYCYGDESNPHTPARMHVDFLDGRASCQICGRQIVPE